MARIGGARFAHVMMLPKFGDCFLHLLCTFNSVLLKSAFYNSQSSSEENGLNLYLKNIVLRVQ